MKIASISYRVPSRALSNDDVIEHIERQNPKTSFSKKTAYLKLVRKLLEKCGAETRHWRDIDGGEKASDLILGVMDDAFEKANMQPSDIDLLIYCGVGKGFLEPANAYFYANAKDMRTVNCFDITDACMSWIRAVQVAYLMIRAGSFRNVMIINGECHLGFHDNWGIRSLRSLEYTFPMYTIGEAATAAIVVPSEDEWQFDYASRPEFADLCTIPLHSYSDFVEPSDRMGLNGINRFVSHGRALFSEGAIMLKELLQKSIDDLEGKAWYFPHAPSKTIYRTGLTQYGIQEDKIYLEVFPRFGNLVSASIPAALSLAEQRGELRRGDSIALVPISAGMVASVVQLTY